VANSWSSSQSIPPNVSPKASKNPITLRTAVCPSPAIMLRFRPLDHDKKIQTETPLALQMSGVECVPRSARSVCCARLFSAE
jgi:hypothetical protein